jgi:hypothetical protein
VSVLHPILYHLFFVVICRSRNLGTTGAFIDVVTHVSGAVCLELRNRHRIVCLRIARARDPARAAVAHASTAAHTPLSTRGDPDSSSIARRRASGFLQVSSSKVSRYQHQGGPPASCAETPSMNANDS